MFYFGSSYYNYAIFNFNFFEHDGDLLKECVWNKYCGVKVEEGICKVPLSFMILKKS